MADMQQQLARLICSACDEDLGVPYISTDGAHALADYLIKHGGILPPCNIGDTVWYELYSKIESAVIYKCHGKLTHHGFVLTEASAKSEHGLEVNFNGECLGKNVFLTREEAEQALKGEKTNDH